LRRSSRGQLSLSCVGAGASVSATMPRAACTARAAQVRRSATALVLGVSGAHACPGTVCARD
jgi:hypothetical protein